MVTFGKCPKCEKGELFQGAIGYMCNYCKSLEDKCDFILYRKYFEKEITPEILSDLITKRRSVYFTDLKNSQGKPFSAFLVLDDDYKVKPSFDEKYLNIPCPVCGGKVTETHKSFFCKGCSLYVYRTIAGTDITGQIDALLKNKKTGYLDFVSNSGKKFVARLCLGSEGKVEFDRDICTCPKCGKGIMYGGDRAYGCSNYNSTNKCTFTIWKEINGKKITAGIVVELCTKKETAIMKGFTNRQGEPVERKLVLLDDFQVAVV